MKKKLFIIFAVSAGIFAAGCAGSTKTSESTVSTTTAATTAETTTTVEAVTTTPEPTTTTEPPTTTTTMSKEDYIAQCNDYEFKEIARNPEAHKGEYARFKGKVIQVLEEDGAYTLRVDITKGEYDIWQDTIMVYYIGSADNNRILEDDIIDMYGQLAGMYTYTTVMGAENSVPLMYAEYIDIN